MAEINVAELARGLQTIVANATVHEPKISRVYILRLRPVRGSGTFKFYVGYTTLTVEQRFEKHLNPSGRVQRVSLFKDSPGKVDVYEPVEIAYDLMIGFPEFPTRSSAQRGERHIANALTARGYPAYSDQTIKRRKRKIDA